MLGFVGDDINEGTFSNIREAVAESIGKIDGVTPCLILCDRSNNDAQSAAAGEINLNAVFQELGVEGASELHLSMSIEE